ncbi:MAG: AAA family ATPase [Bdellovibrionaceae bacterium]|nr:AAA family ATPase [Pseudobdellovibrionaceae bacterium]
MLSHISFSVSDLQKSSFFYDAVLGAIGYKRVYSSKSAAGWGPDEDSEKFVIKKRVEKALAPSKGFHVAFHARQIDDVHAFHAQGIRHGGSDNGKPGPRPEYGPRYYAAFLIDPDGYEIEVKLKLSSAKKALILVRGLGGTGKTTLSSSLSRTLQFPVLNRDDVKESVRDLNFDLKMQSEIGYQTINTLSRVQLKNGISVILDANARFHSMQSFYENLALETGSSLYVITCICSDETEWKRRIDERGKTHPVTFEETKSMLIDPFELANHICIDSATTSTEQATRNVLEWMRFSLGLPHHIGSLRRP